MNRTEVMRWWFVFLLAGLACTARAEDTTPAPVIIGYVKFVHGEAFIQAATASPADPSSAPMSATIGMPVTAQATIQTGRDGSLGITFLDDSLLSVGPRTELVMDDYVYEPVAGGLSYVAHLLRGSMNYVSGVIAKIRPQAVRINTPSGVIGVRGTQFVARTGSRCPLFAWLFNDHGAAVLLADADGHVGAIAIQGREGVHLLNTANASSGLDGSSTTRILTDEEVQADYGAALAARPRYPQHFVLYFESGQPVLTAESQALLPQILSSAQAMPDVDVTVIGHTDTAGEAQANAQLAHERARAVADLLIQQGLKAMRLSVDSHGETNLLVPTADETPEPRNRRVEITLR